MKRLVVILLSLAILVLSSQVEARPFDVFHRIFNIWGPSSGSGGDDCSTPQLGNVMNEGFLGTGYELSWAETIGDGTVDEDFALSGTPPAYSCTEGVNITSGPTETYTTWDNGEPISRSGAIDIYLELYIDDVTLADSGIGIIADWFSGSSSPISLVIQNTGGTYHLFASGATDSTPAAIAKDTWYRIKIHSDPTAENSYFQILEVATCDEASECTFSRSATVDGRYLRIGAPVGWGTGESIDVEFGYVNINTP